MYSIVGNRYKGVGDNGNPAEGSPFVPTRNLLVVCREKETVKEKKENIIHDVDR